MFPITLADKVQCLEKLVGIRTNCAINEEYPFYIEDIPGFDVTKLAKMAKATNPSGKDFGKQLINQAARTMMGNLETLLTDGYSVPNTLQDMCSANTLTPVYTGNAGIIIRPIIRTEFGIARIHKLQILTNYTGTGTLYFDDGEKIEQYDVELQENTLMPIDLNYSTKSKYVKVKFTDPTIGVAQVQQTTNSGCGCGSAAKASSPIKISGLLGEVETSTQYGFLPCVSVDCSYDIVVCDLINRLPNIFGLAMLYKVGELATETQLVSDRNNDAVSFNEDYDQQKPTNYAQRYWASLKGSKNIEGINKKINAYLAEKRGDSCIVCETKVRTAYVTG